MNFVSRLRSVMDLKLLFNIKLIYIVVVCKTMYLSIYNFAELFRLLCVLQRAVRCEISTLKYGSSAMF